MPMNSVGTHRVGLARLLPSACALLSLASSEAGRAEVSGTCVAPPADLVSWWAAENDATDETGANPGCVSEDGVFDMMGNLHEWTADPAGTFRGGFFVDTKINGEGCLYRTTAHNTLHWDYSTGFRCCATP